MVYCLNTTDHLWFNTNKSALSQIVMKGFITFVWIRYHNQGRIDNTIATHRPHNLSLQTFFVNFLLCICWRGFSLNLAQWRQIPPVEWHLPGDAIVQSTLYSDLFINTQECSTLTAASVFSRGCVNNKRQLTSHTKGYVYICFMPFQTNAFYKCRIIAICWLHPIKRQKNAIAKGTVVFNCFATWFKRDLIFAF